MKSKYLIFFLFKHTVNSENYSNTPWKLIIGIIIGVVIFVMILITAVISSKLRSQIFQYFTNRIRKYKTKGK